MEGLYSHNPGTKAAVITHPHPLYGGDMYNPVVEAICHAYQKAGFSTLRFNFRGTGRSTGTHDDGIGEKADVASAMAFLGNEGFETLHLSGYSFGSWVNAMFLQRDVFFTALTMVAPPVAFIPFDEGIRLPSLSMVIAGSHDEFAPPEQIRPLLNKWNRSAGMEIIHGADHFFFGFLDDVTERLLGHLGTQ